MAKVTGCMSCGYTGLTCILDMGLQPLAERMTPDGGGRFPLRLIQCGNCGLVQLDYIVDGHEVFPADHPYATGNTRFLREHFGELARRLQVEELQPYDLIVDIGSNDGTFLKQFPAAASYRRVGVEPTNQVLKSGPGIEVYQEFFTPDLATRIVIEHGKAGLVTATNVLAHVPDVHGFLAGVDMLLADDGLFITENHDLRSITEGLQIDTVYHEHLRYYSVASLSQLLGKHGLDVVRVEPIPTHGGSFRTYARHSVPLSNRAIHAAARLAEMCAAITERGEDIYGIGAATRAAPLIHYAMLSNFIECVCEVATSEKIGQVMPGTGIPVVPDSQLIEDQPEYALLFSWHIAADLVRVLRRMGFTGKFIIPLPEPRITDGAEYLSTEELRG